MFNCAASPYTNVLRKIDTCSCKKAARKSAKTVRKDSGCESRSLQGVYRQKDNYINGKLVKSFIFLNAYQATCFHISLACLCIGAYI